MTHDETKRSLTGAFKLAKLDPNGISYFKTDTQAVFDSLFVLYLILPAKLFLQFFLLGADISFISLVGLFTVLLSEKLLFLITAYYLACHLKSPLADIRCMITAKNWGEIPLFCLYAGICVLSVMGILSSASFQLISILYFLVSMLYQWFIVRMSLKCHELTAVGFVLVGIMMSVIRSVLLYLIALS